MHPYANKARSCLTATIRIDGRWVRSSKILANSAYVIRLANKNPGNHRLLIVHTDGAVTEAPTLLRINLRFSGYKEFRTEIIAEQRSQQRALFNGGSV